MIRCRRRSTPTFRKKRNPIEAEIAHAVHVSTLSAIHSDAFDRILIAQAQLEGMTLLTRDHLILKYPVATLVA